MSLQKVDLLLLFSNELEYGIGEIFLVRGLNRLPPAVAFKDKGSVGPDFIAAGQFGVAIRVYEFVADVVGLKTIGFQEVPCLGFILGGGGKKNP